MNCIRAILAIPLVLLLGSCGEVERYPVFTSLTFEDGAGRSRQVLAIDCEIVEQRWRLPILKRARGETHWVARADGSVLVLEPVGACDGRRPAADQPIDLNEPLDPSSTKAGLAEHSSWLFDRRDRPGSVDELNTLDLLNADRGLRISSVDLTTGPATTTATLADGFPGLATLEPSNSRILSRGIVRMIEAGTWVGARAELWRVRPGETCVDPVPTEQCADRVRYLRATPDPAFSLLTVDTGQQAPAYRMTYHDPRRVLGGSPRRIWRPMICVGNHCGLTPAGSEPLVLPGERTDLVVVVQLLYRDMNQRSFEPI